MKKLLSLLLAVGLVALVAATPAQAQENNSFNRFFGGLRAQLQRLYLQLPGEKPGRTVLEQSLMAMETVETANVTSLIQLESVPVDNPPFTFVLTTEGVVSVEDQFDPATWQQQAAFRGTLVSEDLTLPAEGTWIQNGRTNYLFFSEVPAVPLIATSRLKGTWMRLEPAEAADQSSPTEVDQQELRQAYLELLQAAEVSPARREALNNEAVFVIEVLFPDEALMSFSRRIADLTEARGDLVSARLNRLAAVLAEMEPITATVYVDRTNYYLRRLFIPLELPLAPLTNDSQTGVAQVTIETNWSVFNQPVIIDVPTDSRPLSEVLAEVLPTGEGGALLDLESLRSELEVSENEGPIELDKP